MSWLISHRFREFLRNYTIRNEELKMEAIKVDTQAIESTFTEEYTENQDKDIITPKPGNSLVIKDVAIHTKANSGTVKLDFNDKKVARLYAAANNRFQPAVSSIRGDANESLKLETTTDSSEVFIIVNYIECKGVD